MVEQLVLDSVLELSRHDTASHLKLPTCWAMTNACSRTSRGYRSSSLRCAGNRGCRMEVRQRWPHTIADVINCSSWIGPSCVWVPRGGRLQVFASAVVVVVRALALASAVEEVVVASQGRRRAAVGSGTGM